MGGASASAVPAASSAGGYASKGAMSAATVGGTTGSNVSGMGWVPRAQAASGGGMNYAELARLFGGAVKDSSKQLGSAVANQQTGGTPSLTGYSFDPSAFYQSAAPSPFLGLRGNFPGVSGVRQVQMTSGMPRSSMAGYSI